MVQVARMTPNAFLFLPLKPLFTSCSAEKYAIIGCFTYMHVAFYVFLRRYNIEDGSNFAFEQLSQHHERAAMCASFSFWVLNTVIA